ncbi:MAG: OmpA family protein [Phycisphaerae bacterium]|nr:OmpA family protein [Phycisphaerae bacterium]
MGRERKKLEEEPDEVPAWIISFTDMITLLLAFFVLLQAFAHEQTPELFFEGQGSFRRAIKGMGIPRWLYGKKKRVKRSFYVNKYPAEPDKEKRKNRPILNANRQRLQRMFQKLKEETQSESGSMLRTIRVEAMPIKFSPGSAELDAQARSSLDNLAVELSSNPPAKRSAVYLIGLAPDASSPQKQWVLSGRRARAAERYLREKIVDMDRNWTLHAWGGGRQFGSIPKGSYVGLVIMGSG